MLSQASLYTAKTKAKPMEGFEPTTCCLQNSCSNQLSYIGI